MLPPQLERALVVQCVLDDRGSTSLHAEHFVVRDVASDGTRSLDKYLEPLRRDPADSGVTSSARARDVGVAVIENVNMDSAVAELMELVFTEAEQLQDDEAD